MVNTFLKQERRKSLRTSKQ